MAQEKIDSEIVAGLKRKKGNEALFSRAEMFHLMLMVKIDAHVIKKPTPRLLTQTFFRRILNFWKQLDCILEGVMHQN